MPCAQLPKEPLKRLRTRRILGDAGTSPVVIAGCIEHRSEERVVVLVIRPCEHADKVRLVVIRLTHLESEAVARGDVFDGEQRVPGENELK